MTSKLKNYAAYNRQRRVPWFSENNGDVCALEQIGKLQIDHRCVQQQLRVRSQCDKGVALFGFFVTLQPRKL